MSIYFHKEYKKYPITHLNKIRSWILDCIKDEDKVAGEINYIFTSDRSLLKLNEKFLKHKDYTDILTFDFEQEKISGDIYISTDRVKENSGIYKIKYHDELLRVMIHGILHLCGYMDKTRKEKSLIREKENIYLAKWNEKYERNV